jgi:hypothetical protein
VNRARNARCDRTLTLILSLTGRGEELSRSGIANDAKNLTPKPFPWREGEPKFGTSHGGKENNRAERSGTGILRFALNDTKDRT